MSPGPARNLHLEYFLLQRGDDLIAICGDDYGVLDPHGALSWEDDLGLHGEGHPLLEGIEVPLGKEGGLSKLQADAVADEVGLKPRWAQVTVLVPQPFGQPDGILEEAFAVVPWTDLRQDGVVDLPAGLRRWSIFSLW